MNIVELQNILKNLNINISAREISKIWGIDEASFSRKRKMGSEIKYEHILLLEQKLNINLTGGHNIISDDVLKIPYWEQFPEEMKRNDYPYVVILKTSLKDWKKETEKLRIITMNGDRLENYWYKIRNNDVLIIDTAENKINTNGSGLYFATSRNNNMFWVREMQMLYNGGIEFNSYPPFGHNTKVITPEELKEADFKVIGKVIKNVSFTL